MAIYGEVVEVKRLSPSLVRVVLGGPGLDSFESNGFADQYVNAMFLPEGAPYTVPFNEDAVRELDRSLRPVGRRYTIRKWDAEKRQVTIDFVTHGDVGFAGKWASNAQVGDKLQISPPGGAYSPDPTADGHLLVGDESAIPAIALSLELLEPGAQAIAVLIVDDAENEIPLDSAAQVETIWVHRKADPENNAQLLQTVQSLTLPQGRVHVFVHGEAAEVRSVRKHLLADRGIPKDGNSISPYWRRNLSDEEWREVKRAWMMEQEQDVPV